MHAGALIIIGIGYAGLCAFALAAFALAGRADDATDQALGDWPAIHPEMMGVKPAGGNRTAGEAKSGRRASVTNGTQLKQTTSTHSLQPAKSAGQGAN